MRSCAPSMTRNRPGPGEADGGCRHPRAAAACTTASAARRRAVVHEATKPDRYRDFRSDHEVFVSSPIASLPARWPRGPVGGRGLCTLHGSQKSQLDWPRIEPGPRRFPVLRQPDAARPAHQSTPAPKPVTSARSASSRDPHARRHPTIGRHRGLGPRDCSPHLRSAFPFGPSGTVSKSGIPSRAATCVHLQPVSPHGISPLLQRRGWGRGCRSHPVDESSSVASSFAIKAMN